MTILQLQVALNKLGTTPQLKEDGKSGPATIQAIKNFQSKNGLKPDGLVGKFTLTKINSLLIKDEKTNFSYLRKGNALLTNSDLKKLYGNPCDVKNLVVVTLPYPLKLAWNKTQTVTKIQVHKAIKDKIVKVFTELLSIYGINKIKELGLDIYGGAYNCRQMRTSKAWSVHSWGLAIDLDPERNGLNIPFLKSQFAKKEYAKLHEIFYKHGFINLGIEANMDSMHFQIAK